jgi:hypothetical protein
MTTLCSRRPRLWLAVLTGLILLVILPKLAYAASVGRVLSATGEVTATQPDGRERPLVNDAEILDRDTLTTGVTGAAQVRFNDGALVSLRAGTVFRVDEYLYPDRGAGQKGFFSLIRGAYRTLTGLLGKTNRGEYQVNTPLAVIGVRGTDYAARLCRGDCPVGYPDGLYLSVYEGMISATNRTGEYLIKKGESVFIPDPDVRPSPLQQAPDLLLGANAGYVALDTVVSAPAPPTGPIEFRGVDNWVCVR